MREGLLERLAPGEDNTVKTQAMSAYRKLDATSRAEAVANAVSVGLIDPAAVSAIIFVGRND